DACEDREDIQVRQSKTHKPVPQADGNLLHSVYDPEQEAARMVRDLPGPPGTLTVFGLGFGYHLREILCTVQGPVNLIEPSMGMFCSFLETVDLAPFLPRVRFWIDQPPPRLLARFNPETWKVWAHPPSVRRNRTYFLRLETGMSLQAALQRESLRILVLPPIYGGSLPTAQFCAEALRELGHLPTLAPCDRFADSFSAVGDITKNPEHSAVLADRFMGMMEEMIMAQAAAAQPDLIIGLAQAPLGKSGIARLRALGAPIVFWFVEDFRTLTYWQTMAVEYDHFFTIQQGEFHGALRGAGCPDAYYLPQGCHPAVHRPLTLTREDVEQYGAEVSFMGAPYYNRQQAFTRLLDLDLKIWGSGWDPGSVFGRLLQKGGERVTSEECVRIYNGGKVNLNLHSSTFHEGVNPQGDFVNPRTFEIAGCGGFQLVDARSELPELFREGREMATFTTLPELHDRILHFLAHPGERSALAEAGRRRVLAEHTLKHRMQELLLHVFTPRVDWLQERLGERQSPLSILTRQAGPETALGGYLQQFEGVEDFSIKSITDHVQKGEGKLSKEELLLLMVDQVVK
ncbi:MAG: glycosyltransferase, partial [Nitrospinaceae bacterium]